MLLAVELCPEGSLDVDFDTTDDPSGVLNSASEVALKQLVEVYVGAQLDPLLSTIINDYKAYIVSLTSHSTKVFRSDGKWTLSVMPHNYLQQNVYLLNLQNLRFSQAGL
jgi:hypothetical protein